MVIILPGTGFPRSLKCLLVTQVKEKLSFQDYCLIFIALIYFNHISTLVVLVFLQKKVAPSPGVTFGRSISLLTYLLVSSCIGQVTGLFIDGYVLLSQLDWLIG